MISAPGQQRGGNTGLKPEAGSDAPRLTPEGVRLFGKGRKLVRETQEPQAVCPHRSG